MQPSTGASTGSHFRMHLAREDLRPVGIQVAYQPSEDEGLVISSIHPNAELVNSWNLEHPNEKLLPGMAIQEINGRRDGLGMVLQMRLAVDLDLLIARDLSVGQKAALNAAVEHPVLDAVTRDIPWGESRDKSEMCSICLEEMGTSPACELKCAHQFHKECIQKWLLSGRANHRCPLCNYSVACSKSVAG